MPSIGHTPETEGLLKSLPIPLIEVGNLPKRPIHFAVGHSDFEAGYLATRRLIDGGRRRIAIICGHVRDTSNARDRLNGYRKALREGGLDFVEKRVAEVDHAVDAGLAGLARLIESAGAFDGLVVAGEIWTSATLLELLKRGRRIPKEIAVVGVGEVELGRYLPVPLTYVALPRYETGKAAAELALTLVDRELPRDMVMRLPVKLIASESG